jgi:hypothetical protein
MYKYIREQNVRHAWNNPVPVPIGRTVTAHMSRQMTAFVFCAECEDRFNRNGDKWFAEEVCKGDSVPLLDRLNVARPHYPFQDAS